MNVQIEPESLDALWKFVLVRNVKTAAIKHVVPHLIRLKLITSAVKTRCNNVTSRVDLRNLLDLVTLAAGRFCVVSE